MASRLVRFGGPNFLPLKGLGPFNRIGQYVQPDSHRRTENRQAVHDGYDSDGQGQVKGVMHAWCYPVPRMNWPSPLIGVARRLKR